jgi:hypothetical protein
MTYDPTLPRRSALTSALGARRASPITAGVVMIGFAMAVEAPSTGNPRHRKAGPDGRAGRCCRTGYSGQRPLQDVRPRV